MTDGVQVFELADYWDQSDDPLTLFEQDDPQVQTGSYVIEPGEKVPESGMTSHEGPEISIILDGEIHLKTRNRECDVTSGSLSVIPAGVEHASQNMSDKPCRLVYTIVGSL